MYNGALIQLFTNQRHETPCRISILICIGMHKKKTGKGPLQAHTETKGKIKYYSKK